MNFLTVIIFTQCFVSLAFLSLFYLIPVTLVLTSAYGCYLAVNLECMIFLILYSGRQREASEKEEFLRIIFGMLIMSLGLGGLCIFLEYFKIWGMPPAVLVVIHLLLLGACLVYFLSVLGANSRARSVREKNSRRLSGYDNCIGLIRICLTLTENAEQLKMLRKVHDEILYGDSVSRPELSECEMHIQKELEQLQEILMAHEESIEVPCRNILKDIRMRQEKLRFLKQQE